LIEHRRRAPLADLLIAQSCLDHGVPLVTRDVDFRHIARIADFRLLP
jgi:predicted nucleic acid-binding protein